MTTPRIGDTIHYTSHGTPVLEDGTQAFPSVCRAATVTELITDHPRHLVDPRLAAGPNPNLTIGAVVNNPTGQFFHSLDNGGIPYDTHGAYIDEDGETSSTYTGFTPGTWHHIH